jgi:hypothetical protein
MLIVRALMNSDAASFSVKIFLVVLKSVFYLLGVSIHELKSL